MNESSRAAKNRLESASRAKDTFHRMALALTVAGGAALLVLAVAMLDYWLLLPKTARLAGTAVIAGLAAAGLWKLWRSWTRPTALKEAALDAEKARPELGCEISTAAEYISGARKVTQEYEADLAAALQSKAAQNLEKLNLPYWKRPMRPFLVLSVVVFAALIFVVVASGGWTAFQRAALPWSDAAYTQVEVKPGNLEVPVGHDVEIRSMFTGRIPEDARFEWQEEEKAVWQTAALTRNDKGEYIHGVKNVQKPLVYRVSGSDAVSPAFTVHPYVPPEVKDWLVEVRLPAYVQRPGFTQTTPDIMVLRGSTAFFRISPNVKLSKAQLRFKDQPPVDLRPTETGFWTGEVKISKDTEFTVDLADEKGRAGAESKSFQIKALSDLAPIVEITVPGEDMRTEATNTIPVKAVVSDDYGLDEIKLVYRKLGGPAQFITAKRQGETNSEFAAEISLASLELKEYELVAYHAEAADNNTLDGPGIGKSKVFFIEITSEEGGKSKGKPQPGEKVNLLVVQKEIIADTTELAANATKEEFQTLAKRQRDAMDFGDMYLKSLAGGNAPPELALQMQSVLRHMKTAAEALEKSQQSGALPAEENALAGLYKTLQMKPELAELPVAPKMPQKPPQQAKKEEKKEEEQKKSVNVVLDAIKKQKKPTPEDQALAEALEEAVEMQEEQASLLVGVQNAAEASPEGGGAAETQMDRSPKKKSEQAAASKEGQKAPAAKSAQQAKSGQQQGKEGQGGEGEGEGEGQGKEGQMAQAEQTEKEQDEQEQKSEEKDSQPKKEPKEAQLAKNEAKSKGKGQGQGQGQGKGEGKGKGKGQGKGQGEGKGESGEKSDSQQENQPKQPQLAKSEQKPQGKGKGQGQGQGQGQGKGKQPGQLPGKGQEPSEETPTPGEELQKLAEQQEDLSEQAKELAEKLERIAGQDKRLGHGAGKKMNEVAEKMKEAAAAMGRGQGKRGGTQGAESAAGLEGVIALLESILQGRAELADVSQEDFPKEYEAVIADYLKKLSYAE